MAAVGNVTSPVFAIVAFVGAVVASKEEQLVLLDGATESAAKIIELNCPPFGPVSKNCFARRAWF